MAAQLIPAPAPQQWHLLRLPPYRGSADLITEVGYGLGDNLDLKGPVQLLAGDWPLGLRELKLLQERLAAGNLWIARVRSSRPESLVAAAALGLETEAEALETGSPADSPASERPGQASPGNLTIHRGTLRSGDHLQSEGSVLLLGDLNPGARISAVGHVLVWGRLRGVAHAGVRGDRDAVIVALQLRPLQLRIADAVARGPQEAPAAGQAEQARLVEGEIRIDPADPLWPLSD
jgi:septum site-determining protein MinC